ncbi:MAG: aminomethyl-transferring glycine dehydrogenase subunit GcvPA [Pseudomonadota bacterium]|nr:aminomethyl-transferring glycine dehydrogenase subunit GcvPA [Pseudomonadota bacterium]
MRYLPLTEADRKEMLEQIGVSSLEELYQDVPNSALLKEVVALPAHKGEMEVEALITELARKNKNTSESPSFLGAGTYRHHIPAAADHLIQRGEFLTSYTPYQPEISQGTLQALFEFQTQVALITGMEVANASLYDGATSCAEACMMACRITRKNKILLSGNLHPHYQEVTESHAKYLDLNVYHMPRKKTKDLLDYLDENLEEQLDEDTACIVVQNPDFFGHVKNLSSIAEKCHAVGTLLVVVVNEIVSLGAMNSPGSMGADIVAGEGQSLGNAQSFGGPHLGLLATRERFVRQMPGRLVGETKDSSGKRGWVLTLSTREQHIRREKATSNICTNSGLCALAFSIHLTLLGETGFVKLSKTNHAKANLLESSLKNVSGVRIINKTYFNEFVIQLVEPAESVVEKLVKKNVLAGVPISRLIPNTPILSNLLLVTATEMTSKTDIEILCTELSEVLS